MAVKFGWMMVVENFPLLSMSISLSSHTPSLLRYSFQLGKLKVRLFLTLSQPVIYSSLSRMRPETLSNLKSPSFEMTSKDSNSSRSSSK